MLRKRLAFLLSLLLALSVFSVPAPAAYTEGNALGAAALPEERLPGSPGLFSPDADGDTETGPAWPSSQLPEGALPQLPERGPRAKLNPLWAELYSAEEIAALEQQARSDPSPRLLASGSWVETPLEAAEKLHSGLRKQLSSIEIRVILPMSVYADDDQFQWFLDYLWETATQVTTDGLDGDYLAWKWSYQSLSISFSDSDWESVWLVLTYTVAYHGTTAAQEAEMAAKADAVIAGFGFTDQTSAYDKIQTVYDYIAKNIRYTADENIGKPIYHTAYSAIIRKETVCQGYASLLYYMLWSVGVPCRIVVSADHAWNIVWLRGQWYNLDVTWDENPLGPGHDYFLKGKDSFYGQDPSHIPESSEAYGGLYLFLADSTSESDYGERRAEDDGCCEIHEAAEEQYFTDSGEECSYCSVCGQSITFPLWQGEAGLELDKEQCTIGETLQLSADPCGAGLFLYGVFEVQLVDGEYETGELVGVYGPVPYAEITFTPYMEGQYEAMVVTYKDRWSFGFADAIFEVVPPIEHTEGDWTYTVVDGMATVTAFNSDIWVCMIPAELGGCPVTAIGPEAFRGNSDLTVLAIPDSILRIGDSAFSGCTGLQVFHFSGTAEQWYALEVGDGNELLLAAEGYVYAGASTTGLATQNVYVNDVFSSCALFYCEPGTTVTVWAACYDADGRFLNAAPWELTPGVFSELEMPLGSARRVRFFALDDGCAPVCAALDAPETE